MKTNIKMRVTPEQSKRVQEICFENGVEWLISCKLVSHLSKPCLIIENSIITYRDYGRELEHNINIEEIDADLFIRTNGTCEETFKEQQSYNNGDLIIKDDNIHMIEKTINKHYDITILEQKLQKKNEILKKARIKRKNQREELHKLNLKLQKCISLEEHDLKMKTVLNEKHYLEKENKSLKESSKISCNMLHSQKDKIDRLELNYVIEKSNYKKEIEKLKAVIEYLESKVK